LFVLIVRNNHWMGQSNFNKPNHSINTLRCWWNVFC
jgi:hypothetical protein